MNKLIDLIGLRFGRLTVIKRAKNSKTNKPQWLCRCDCGKIVTILGYSLRENRTISCGCARIKHGHTIGGKVSKTYRSWISMCRRCLDKKDVRYKDYGGRKIKICKQWLPPHGFINFLKDMGEKPNGYELDRINNNKGYYPNNCKWSTEKEQARNKRNNDYITFNGKTLILRDWAKELQINYRTLWGRIYILGWSIKKAFTIPVKLYKKRKNKNA